MASATVSLNYALILHGGMKKRQSQIRCALQGDGRLGIGRGGVAESLPQTIHSQGRQVGLSVKVQKVPLGIAMCYLPYGHPLKDCLGTKLLVTQHS
eukprot:5097207-Amphidinium_carterae.1